MRRCGLVMGIIFSAKARLKKENTLSISGAAEGKGGLSRGEREGAPKEALSPLDIGAKDPLRPSNDPGGRAVKNTFIREKAIHCGKDFLTPEIFPYTGKQQQAVKGRRGKKVNVTGPAQKNLNERRAKRYFIQLALANFGRHGAKDIVVHLTYAPEFLPETEEEAQKIGAVDYLVQGTIYPDVIESGLCKSAVIKSHHNVVGLPYCVDFK